MLGKSKVILVVLFVSLVMIAGSVSADETLRYVMGELVIKLAEGTTIDDINARYATTTGQYLPQIDIYSINADGGGDLEAIAAQIESDPDVLFCHPNYRIDPGHPLQGSLPVSDVGGSGGDYNNQSATQSLHVNEAHAYAMGNGTKIAIIDGGINYNHPAFTASIVAGYDYVDEDGDAFDDIGGTTSGHGTFIAGVIQLIAPGAEIRAYRVTDVNGGSNGYLVAEAITQAVDDGCRVINLSLVMYEVHDAVRDAVAYARANDALVIVAAGNVASTQAGYPASDSNTIAVAAVDSSSFVAGFTTIGDDIDVCAPGVDIYAPYLDSSYAWWSGTSFSAPFVAAQAALLISLDPRVSWDEVRDIIISTSIDIDALNDGYNGQLGAGLIDPLASLMALLGSGISLRVPSEYLTINAAIDAAYHGDTILVGPGTYYEEVNLDNKSLKVISEQGPKVTTIIPPQPQDMAIVMNGTYLPGSEIRGFSFTGGIDDHVVWVASGEPVIADNIFYGNYTVGDENSVWSVIICYSENSLITRNLFYNNGNTCIDRGPNVRVINNTFDSNKNVLVAENTGGVKNVINNIITNSSYLAVRVRDDSTQNDLAYNNVWNNLYNYNSFDGEGSYDISVDPTYVDVARGDYRLLPGSPCIDAGHPDAMYNDPNGSRNDMGAYPSVDIALPLCTQLDVGPMSDNGHLKTLIPKFFWQYIDTAASGQQQYQIQIGTDDDWTVLEQWDSGPVVSSADQITYSGPALADFTAYYARVRLYSGTSWGDWAEIYMPTSAGTLLRVPGDFPTIQGAIDMASGLDTVLVSDGLYVEAIDFKGTRVHVLSENGPLTTIIESPSTELNTVSLRSGENSYAILEGFTIRNGSDNVHVANYSSPQIRNNRILNATQDGLHLSWSEGIVVEGNFFDNNHVGMKADYSAVTVENNVILNSVDRGMHFIRSDNCIVRNNVVALSGGEGMRFYQGDGTYIRNNTIIRSGGAGLYLQSSGFRDVRNNIVVFSTSNYGIVFSQASGLVLEYNCAYGNIRGDFYGYTPGVGSISLDPLFVDVEGLDLNLRAGSPCVDAGDSSAVYNDADGSRSDMGAFPRLVPVEFPVATSFGFAPEMVPGIVTSLTPEISWSYFDTAVTTQQQFQIQVSNDMDWTIAEMWDSGPVAGGDQSITYAGSPLTDFRKYNVRIRVDNGTGWGEWRESSFRTKVGTVIHVPSMVSTIVDAIGISVAGDSILVGPGTYYEIIRFADANDLVLKSTDGPEVTFLESESGTGGVMEFIGVTDSTVVIEGFTFRNCATGISFNYAGVAKIIGNIFDGQTQSGIHGIGSFSSQGLPLVIRNNFFTGIKRPVYTYQIRIIFEDNIVANCSSDSYGGIEFGYCRYGRMAGNLFKNNHFSLGQGGDLSLWGGQYNEVENNTFYNFTNDGYLSSALLLTRERYSVVRNNIVAFSNNAYGISNNSPDSTQPNIFEYNNVFGNSEGDYANIESPGVGSISVDPMFTDTAAGDLSLLPGSPCIDAADPGLIYNDPDGTRGDMGAIPYNGPVNYPVPMNIALEGETNRWVVSHTPTISWSYLDTTAAQSAYEMQVGIDNDWTTAEMWSTGVVNSSDTSSVYAGTVLVDGTTYVIRVRVNNGNNWGDWRGGVFIMNLAPPTPVVIGPLDGTFSGHTAPFEVEPVIDPDGILTSYEFQLFTDSALADLNQEIFVSGPNYSGTVSAIPSPELEINTSYWWRARSFDMFEYSPWTAVHKIRTFPNEGWFELVGPNPDDGIVYCNEPTEFVFRLTNSHNLGISGMTNGIKMYSPDDAQWNVSDAYWDNSEFQWTGRDGAFNLIAHAEVNDGQSIDTIEFGGAKVNGDGFPSGTAAIGPVIATWFDCSEEGKTICLDSTFFAPGGTWQWAVGNTRLYPYWEGPYCFTIESCCEISRGDANSDGASCDIVDVTFIVDYLFGGGDYPSCMSSANVTLDGRYDVDITDLTYMIDFVFGTGPPPPSCDATYEGSLAKLSANSKISLLTNYANDTTTISLQSDIDLRGLQISLRGTGGRPELIVDNGLDMPFSQQDSILSIGILDLDGVSLIKADAGQLIRIAGDYEIVEALASDVSNTAIEPVFGKGVGVLLPTRYSLQQNYPNPFNPSTTIQFALPERADVTISVYNILGRKVTTLVDEKLPAGYHSIVWSGTNSQDRQVASGVYFYRIVSDKFTQSKKMLLLK